MNAKMLLKTPKNAPVIVGTGLIALDVVYNGHPTQPIGVWAGGTCGNVLAILSWLGWEAWPIARLRSSDDADRIVADLDKCGVRRKFVTTDRKGTTPVIVQRIKKDEAGNVSHRFSMRCPQCRSYLPQWRSVTSSAAMDIKDLMPEADVFFFDRTSRGILDLAAAAGDAGALVVFEPIGIANQRHFREAIELADIVKFSSDRLNISQVLRPKDKPLLAVQTLGGRGLRYRCQLAHYETAAWHEISAIPVKNIRDSAGAGDWCTAGIIHAIHRFSDEPKTYLKKGELLDALRFGQTLAAWNCLFEGARGGMYELSKAKLPKSLAAITANRAQDSGQEIHNPKRSHDEDAYQCTQCSSG